MQGPVFHRAGIGRARDLAPTPCNSYTSLLFLPGLSGAGVAQLVEHLICNQRVGGSIPSASSTKLSRLADKLGITRTGGGAVNRSRL